MLDHPRPETRSRGFEGTLALAAARPANVIALQCDEGAPDREPDRQRSGESIPARPGSWRQREREDSRSLRSLSADTEGRQGRHRAGVSYGAWVGSSAQRSERSGLCFADDTFARRLSTHTTWKRFPLAGSSRSDTAHVLSMTPMSSIRSSMSHRLASGAPSRAPRKGLIARRAGAVITVSSAIAERLEEIYSLPTRPAVLLNCPPLEEFEIAEHPQLRAIYQAAAGPGRQLEDLPEVPGLDMHARVLGATTAPRSSRCSPLSRPSAS